MRQTFALAVQELLDSLWELFVDAFDILLAIDPLHALFAAAPERCLHKVEVVVLGYWVPPLRIRDLRCHRFVRDIHLPGRLQGHNLTAGNVAGTAA